MTHPSNPQFDAGGNPVSAEDWLGNRFSIGDQVMYCIGAGRGQMMAIGTVQALRVKESSKLQRVDNPAPQSSAWRDRFLFVDAPPDKWVVEVQVLTERTSSHWGNGQRSRPAWVNEMNITAITGPLSTKVTI